MSEQSPYNLMERTVELEVLPACQAYGLGVLPWSPLAGALQKAEATQGTRFNCKRHRDFHAALTPGTSVALVRQQGGGSRGFVAGDRS